MKYSRPQSEDGFQSRHAPRSPEPRGSDLEPQGDHVRIDGRHHRQIEEGVRLERHHPGRRAAEPQQGPEPLIREEMHPRVERRAEAVGHPVGPVPIRGRPGRVLWKSCVFLRRHLCASFGERQPLIPWRAIPSRNFFWRRYPPIEAPVSLSGTLDGAFFTAGVFATTSSSTRRIVQLMAAIVAFALFTMHDNPQSNTKK